MAKYVIKRYDDNKWVARSGLPSSYTQDLELARVWDSRDAASREACSNEVVLDIEDVVGKGKW